MKKLGSGWQYTVYDLDNCRVLKRYHSPLKSFWAVLKGIFPFTKNPPWVVFKWMKELQDKAEESFAVIERKSIPKEWLGNPKRLTGLDFEQDKVTPLHDVLAKLSVAEQKEIVESFIEFTKKLLSIGVVDQNFDITKNFGLSADGHIVLSDIGELFDDPAKIERRLKKRIWTASYVAGCIDDTEVRRYFIERMDAEFGLKG